MTHPFFEWACSLIILKSYWNNVFESVLSLYLNGVLSNFWDVLKRCFQFFKKVFNVMKTISKKKKCNKTYLRLRWCLCSAAANIPNVASSSLEPLWWWCSFGSWVPGGSRLFVRLPWGCWLLPVWLTAAASRSASKNVERCVIFGIEKQHPYGQIFPVSFIFFHEYYFFYMISCWDLKKKIKIISFFIR